MKMTILKRDDDITHVVLTGRLDTTAVEEIGEEFADATAARERPAIVDLSAIDFMASRGIGLLFANGKRLLRSGQKLVLLNPQEIVASVLNTSQVDKVMPILHDFDEAVRMLGGVVTQPETVVTPAADDISSQVTEPVPSAREGEVKVAIKNELSELAGLNAMLAQFLEEHDVPHRAAYAVNLAIDEMVVNVIRYAYVDDDEHLIDIKLSIEGPQVILQIEDDGRPFDPRRGPSLDLHAEDREAGGLGLILVLDMVDVLKYQRADEKNCVEIRIQLPVAENERGEYSTGEPSNVPSAG